mmetsp:Transcript_88020/g.284190  ORF Transcript_88020/g.284190 Transcript_88020/m.284190 type:complete len:211 (+) Transcript_88020:28-660(+)
MCFSTFRRSGPRRASIGRADSAATSSTWWRASQETCSWPAVPRVVRVVELGMRMGPTGLHLLSRYAWVRYVGVDNLGEVGRSTEEGEELRARFSTYGSRARILAPMNTTEAAQVLQREGLSFDVLVLDARFDRGGVHADVATWLRLLPLGGYAISRAGMPFYWGMLARQRLLLGDLHLCTAVNGFAYYHRVKSGRDRPDDEAEKQAALST